MKTFELPNTDLTVAAISLGSAVMGSEIAPDTSFAILDAYVGAGGNFIDSAHVYAEWLPGGRHKSEKTIGQWLKRSGQRDRVVLATKGAHPDMARMDIPRLAPADIAHDLDESLACLGVEQIDLYWLHRDDPARTAGEILETLNAQKKAGKLRYFGCSNWKPARIREAQAYAQTHHIESFAASQILWSLAVPNPGAFASDYALMDAEAQAFYATAGMGVLAFTSQARGLFSRAAAEGVAALKPDRMRDFGNPETLARLDRVQTVARQLGVTVSAVVLAYITSQQFVGVPIIGPNTVAQLNDSLAAADLTLTPETVRFLETGRQ